MMLGVRYTPNGKFFRIAGQHMSNTNLVADGDLKTNNNNLLILPDLWQATLFIEKQASLRGQPIELVELEMREVRVIPSLIDAKAEPPNEADGDKLSITPIVRP